MLEYLGFVVLGALIGAALRYPDHRWAILSAALAGVLAYALGVFS